MRSVPNFHIRAGLLFALLLIALNGHAVPPSSAALVTGHALYLPAIQNNYPWISPFSVEVTQRLSSTLVAEADELGVGWMRLRRLYWRDVQPTEQSDYDWSALSGFEEELRLLAETGIQPVVIVHHSPDWATVHETSCSAIRQDKFNAFAAFMAAAANRYKTSEFNVHHWELGNEPDVDPSLVPPDNVFGCWGDAGDPYYGGRHYGEMLQVVAPAIRDADPEAKILIGGLLLDSPTSLEPGANKPSLFLKGILESGAADDFDMVPYHFYSSYSGVQMDYDRAPGLSWASRGGMTLGKARFLRQIMAEYGVDKPLLLNETALSCNPQYQVCDPPIPAFFEAQADHLVRTFVRALSADVGGLTWYTLNGPGWRQGGLLNADGTRRPAFIAYRALAQRLNGARYDSAADYGAGIEAYRFSRSGSNVHVVWSTDSSTHTIRILQSQLLHAHNRSGELLVPTPAGDFYELTVGFEPIYLELRR